MPRLVYQPHIYQDLIDIYPSKNSKLEFCLGTILEMTEGDVFNNPVFGSKTSKLAGEDRVAAARGLMQKVC